MWRTCHTREATVLVSILIRWVLLTVAVALAAWTVPDVDLRGGPPSAMWVAVLIAVANVLAQLLMKVLPSPGSVLLLAALTLAVNGLAVWVVSAFTSRLHVDGFVDAVAFALMVTVFSVALGVVADRMRPRDEEV
jgi:putative membrane protein